MLIVFWNDNIFGYIGLNKICYQVNFTCLVWLSTHMATRQRKITSVACIIFLFNSADLEELNNISSKWFCVAPSFYSSCSWIRKPSSYFTRVLTTIALTGAWQGEVYCVSWRRSCGSWSNFVTTYGRDFGLRFVIYKIKIYPIPSVVERIKWDNVPSHFLRRQN